MRHRLQYAAFGIVATLVGMAVGHVVASLLNPASSPVLAVGSTVIDSTPQDIKGWAIEQFGSADKPILIGSVLVGVLVLAGVAGVLTAVRFWYGAGLILFLVALSAGAVLTRPTVEIVDVVPVLLTAVAGLLSLWILARLAHGLPVRPDGSTNWAHPMSGDAPTRRTAPTSKPATSPTAAMAEGDAAHDIAGDEVPTYEISRDGGDPVGPAPKRRTLLITTGVMVAVAAVLGGAGRFIGNLRARAEDVALPTPADPAGAFPAGLDKQVPGITPLRIPNADFYRVDTRLDTPVVSSDGWTLEIDGDVDNPVTITFDELLAMPMIERDITLTCVSNSVGGKFVGGARWLGVPLKDVLDLAGIDNTSADQLLATDFDGMTIGTPLDLALDGRDAMVCVGMNGEPLPREHGFPVRVVIPGLYGFISATKWLTKFTLTTYEAEDSYWTERNWDTRAPIKISARIDTPKALQQIPAGETVIGGVAWAQQSGGVAKVQVQIDGGGWQDAELGPDVSNDYWRQWFYRWDAEEGSHNVAARVVDGNGDTQTDVRAQPFPGGSSGIHSLILNVG